jgi:radical SAM protein with 4Fe4S-binding SPASM domain
MMMDFDLFKRIIDQICSNRPLVKLYMSGEPLLHKRLTDMIDYAHDHGCGTMIHTNATLLTEEKAAEILDSHLDTISCSFDGCTPEVYEQVRPPASFSQVKENIESFLMLRNRRDGKTPRVIVEIIKMKQTEPYLAAFVQRWKTSGADDVHVQPCMTWLDCIEDLSVESPPDYGYQPCPALFQLSCFLTEGTVVPCCMDVDGKMPMGNISQTPFREIWRGDRYNELRTKHLERQIESGSICHGCVNLRCPTRKKRLTVVLADLLGSRRRALKLVRHRVPEKSAA